MRPLVYALRFTGRAIPAGPDGNLLTLTATAPGATLECEVTLTGATSFQAIGTITVGDGHRLRFATVGSGYLGPSPMGRHGAAVWRVEGGEEQFAGASGLITSNFSVGVDLAVTDHQLGVIFLKVTPPWLAALREER